MAKVATRSVGTRHGAGDRDDEHPAIEHLGSSHLRDEGSRPRGLEQLRQDLGQASAAAGSVVRRAGDK